MRTERWLLSCILQFKKEQELFNVKKKETNTQAEIQVLSNSCLMYEC